MARSTPYDLVVIGGGINGCGIAADAAGRGLSVFLAEQGDLAGATSSSSSKLIHGGLRYLEHYEFRLVRESLREREVLLAMAPHIVWPLRFLLPHDAGQRPAWMVRAGLFIYDHLARRQRIGGSQAVRLSNEPSARALRTQFDRGFSYWDCWVDDARLVVLNARVAANRGAVISPRTPVTALRRDAGLWRVTLGGETGPRDIAARAVVNAAGPWAEGVGRLAGAGSNSAPMPRVRLVKGSHIVVPRLPGASDAFLFQSPDGRVVFALPFEERFTMIGTTDVPCADASLHVTASDNEAQYLLDVVNRFLKKPLVAAEIVWSFAGVRPLDDSDEALNPAEVTRDYRLVLDGEARGSDGVTEAVPPILHVIGGKITTYRKLAEAALAKLAPFFPGARPTWTAGTRLPGGNFDASSLQEYSRSMAARWPGITPALVATLVRRHGTLVAEILGDATCLADLGTDFGGGLYGREVAYLKANEWARHSDDVLWRRTRTGLHMTKLQREMAAERMSSLL